ncbi:MAG: SDR family NAD(P)-dependent oxidoreductase, partial [Puniceicoccales bacterium]
MFDLSSKTVWVTGSSLGIGNAIGRLFERAGADVLFHAREVSECPAEGDPDRFVVSDFLLRQGPEEAIREAFRRRPKIDTLVANAGSFFDQPFLEMDRSSWEKTL